MKKRFVFSSLLCCVVLSLKADEIGGIESFELEKTHIEAGFIEADTNVRNVEVVGQEQLHDRGDDSITEVLQRTPGVSFVDYGSGKSIDMRGQGEKAGNSVKVMVDGKIINTLDTGHINTPFDTIWLENVDHIEVVPGGSAVLYGDGTRGGGIKHYHKNA
ncbi:hypothetical protein DMB95_04405 [Campylobacter sp. MIT 12-8780]|uniref:TonB-dependent receptor n=1 Tax=Campylobacter sp. MIT 12-8780 TaxID=2202200 RepID=UPI00115EB1E9|nr:Plug domain-containing protein [Campylobacter sp. MIT 12-8780]TQR41593.1 hypothetical protein DMB95_04405 [Campylobacter sp. MIT 12-8780]